MQSPIFYAIKDGMGTPLISSIIRFNRKKSDDA